MEAHPELEGFHGDRPVVYGIVLCDSIAVEQPSQKAVLIGVFENVNAATYPVVINAVVVAMLAGVREPIDCRVEAVGYSAENPLGVRQPIGTAHVEPTATGMSTIYIAGAIVFPVTGPGTADIRVYGNGELLGSRPISIQEIQGM
jgi:hypothetical protein